MNVFLIMKSSEVNLALSINQYKVVDINIGTNMEIFSEIIAQNKVSEIMHIFRELCTSPFPIKLKLAQILVCYLEKKAIISQRFESNSKRN